MNTSKNKVLIITSIIVSLMIIVAMIVYIANRKSAIDTSMPEDLIDSRDQSAETMKVKVVAYCPCSKCNEKWAGLICTGKKMKELTDKNINICAVDPNVIPLGSTLIYDGKEYLATDVGGKIKGNIINILLSTHKEAADFKVKKDQIILVRKK
jgi:3D (Asp-Asp-Asp) domain-containing protein